MADAKLNGSFVIVGAGPAGVRAAEVAVRHRIRPIVIDEADRAGGQIYRRPPVNFSRSYETLYGSEAKKAKDLHETFDRLIPSIDYRPNSLAWAVANDAIHVASGDLTTAIPYDRLILATGATDRIAPVQGWTLPGVYSMGASQIALKAQGCAIGSKVVFVGTGPLLYLVSYQYLKAGNPPLAVLDTSGPLAKLSGIAAMSTRPEQLIKGVQYIHALRKAGVIMQSGIKPLAILGSSEEGVTGIRYQANGRDTKLACNAVGTGYHLRSESQLADLAGCSFHFDALRRQWFPQIDEMGRSSVNNVYLAGDGVRILGADGAEASGRLAALAVLADTGAEVPIADIRKLIAEKRRHERFAAGIQRAFPWPADQIAQLPDDALVCRCEAITAGELRQSAEGLGASEVNRAKAFSRVGMGRCQGRFCGQASQEVVAAAHGSSVETAGRLRGQAPVKPLSVAIHSGDEHA